jgi:hypothetical protein
MRAQVQAAYERKNPMTTNKPFLTDIVESRRRGEDIEKAPLFQATLST